MVQTDPSTMLGFRDREEEALIRLDRRLSYH